MGRASKPERSCCRRAPLPARRRLAAFTLVELMVVVAIVGVLSALSFTLVGATLSSRASSTGSIADVVAEMQLARATAISQGARTVFVLRPTSTAANAPLEYFAFIDRTSTYNASTAATNPPSGTQLLDRTTLATGIVFKKSGSSLFSSALSAPFAKVPATTPCTFCDISGSPKYVEVIFRSDGSAALGSTPNSYTFGGSFTLAAFGQKGAGTNGDGDGRAAVSTQTIAITSHNGTIFAVPR